MNWLYSKWWKWLSVVLLLYVVIGSYMVPLSPGISKIEPLKFSPDSIYTFSISAYHTHFKDPGAGKIQFWFKSGNEYYQAKELHILSSDKAEVNFGVGSNKQDSLASASFDVVGNDDIDGTFALREGITLIKAAKVDSSSPVTATTGPVEVVHNKHQFLLFRTAKFYMSQSGMYFSMCRCGL
jgi:hypothetical protein